MVTFKRKEYYPEIKSLEDLEKYKQMNPAKMSTGDWLWLHPTAYQLIYWGMPSCLLFQAVVCEVLFRMFDRGWLRILAVVFGVLGTIVMLRQYKHSYFNKGMTLFEMFMK